MTTPGGYSAGTIFLQVVPSFRNFQNTVRKAAKEAERAFAESLENGTDLGDAMGKALDRNIKKTAPTAGQRLGEILGKETTKKLDSLLKNLAPVLRIGADTGVAKREIDILLQRALMLRDKIQMGVDVDGARLAEAQLRQIIMQVAALDGKAVNVEANAAVAKAIADIRRLEGAVDSVDGKKIDVDTSGLDRLITRTAGAADVMRSFNGRLLAGATLGPALVPILGALAGGMLALGSAAVGAASGVGVLLLAFSGIGGALKAMDTFAKDGTEQARALAKTQRAAAQAVGDAQRSIGNATRSAAQANEAAADRVQDAQRAVARAHEATARDVRRALAGVQRAERDLADAQRDSVEAQKSLREARKEAAADALDLESKVKAGALNERQALIDLFEAQVAYNAAQQDGGATNLEREEAAIQLERARLAIADQRRENEELRAEQAKTLKQGVDGSQRVQAAQERVSDATQRERDAQESLREARAAVTQAQVDGAARVAEAERGVAEAREAQTEAALAGQQSIADAQRNLSEAQLNYADALAQTTSAADGLKDAMDALSPAGQRFATFIFGLRDEFRRLRDAAQEGLFPGLERAITILLPYLPALERFIGTMGKVLGDIFVQAAEALTSPIWVDFFQMIERLAPTFTRQFAGVLGNLLTIFAQLSTAFAPLAVKIGDAMLRLTDSFVKFLDSERGQKLLADFMGYVERIGPKVIDFLGFLVTAFVNLAIALAPYAESLLGGITKFLEIISEMDPALLGTIATSLLILVGGFQLLVALIAPLTAFAGLIKAIMSIFKLGALAALGLTGGILILVLGLVLLYTQSETARNIINGAFSAIGKVIGFIWREILKPIFDAFIGILRFLADVVGAVVDLVITAFRQLWKQVGEAWDMFAETGAGKRMIEFFSKYVEPIWRGFLSFVGWLWDEIVATFAEGIQLGVDIINNGFIDPFNVVARALGSDTITPIHIGKPKKSNLVDRGRSTVGGVQRFAQGGRVGGFSPTSTSDNIPAWLTAGEFVLPVNAVKKLRAAFGDGFMEWLRGGGGYAKGGLVEFGRLLQSRNFRVSEHPAFGGVRGKHAKGSQHYKNNAIDVNFGPGGESDIEKRAIDAIVGLAKEYSLRTIWRTTGHFNHAHFDGGKGGSIIGRAAGWIKDKAGNIIDSPLSYVAGKLRGLYGNLGDTTLGKFLIGGAEKMLGYGLDKLRSVGAEVGDFFTRDGDDAPPRGYSKGGPVLYDQGGWLPPGLTQVMNATGRPEYIMTPEQMDGIMQGGSSYQINVPMMPTDSTPAQVADAVLFAARQISRGGVYAGKR